MTLEQLLDEAREQYRLELAIPLTFWRPPLLRERDASGELVESIDSTRVGLPMSGKLLLRIDHLPVAYGNTFPVARALDDLRGWCRGLHLEGRGGTWVDHRRDQEKNANPAWTRARPLCARLAYYSIVFGVPLARLARVEGLATSRATDLLRSALIHMWEQRSEWANPSGVVEVLAQQRRERRAERQARQEARERAEAIEASDVACRHCGGPYRRDSTEPCAVAGGDAIAAAIGGVVLCAPGDPS